MSPMTRGRSPGGTPCDLNAEYYSSRAEAGLIFAESTADVSAVMKFATEHRIPVTTRGAGYGYVGGCVPLESPGKTDQIEFVSTSTSADGSPLARSARPVREAT